MWEFLDSVLDGHPHYTHFALTVVALFVKPLIEKVALKMWGSVGKLIGLAK